MLPHKNLTKCCDQEGITTQNNYILNVKIKKNERFFYSKIGFNKML